MSGPLIRRARGEDAPGIADVFLAARARMDYLPRLHTDDETRTWIAGHVVPETEVWVAERGGEIAGFASLNGRWLDHLYIDPRLQGEGIGTALLDRAKRERPTGLRLRVFVQNEGARRFYRRHGFVLEAESDGRDNEEHLPDRTLRWG